MLAHAQGAQLNASSLAANLNVSTPTIIRYVDLMVDLLLLRRLRPYHINIKKHLVKTPKVYVRDSGLLHALLNIGDRDALFGHPVIGASWESFVIETLIACAPVWTNAFFYRTATGNEIDLLLELPDGAPWAIEIKRGLSPKIEQGFHLACNDLKPARKFVVYGGDDAFAMPHDVEAVSLLELANMLKGLAQ